MFDPLMTSRRGFLRQSASILSAAGLCASAAADGDVSRNSDQRSPMIVIAHRGAHAKTPENTLAAFRKAIELRCDFVEMDVRSTKDGSLVILHDSTLDRTTNGSGNVADLTLSSVRALAVKNPLSVDLSTEKVPTFDEALAVCRGKIKVYVDHKTGTPAGVIEAIRKHEMLDDVVVYAPIDRLRQFKRLRPELRVVSEHPAKQEEIAVLATELRPLCLDGHHLKWSRDQVDDAHRAGSQVWVDMLGPFDGPIGYLLAAKMGVDAMQTDHPEMLVAWRDGVQNGAPHCK